MDGLRFSSVPGPLRLDEPHPSVGWEAARLHAGHRPPLNCTCRFPAYSFHKDSTFRVAIEGIN
jgi:hypothetical protein